MRDTPSTGIDAAKKRRNAVEQVVPVPEGLELSTELSILLWAQYSRMKLVEDWRTGDLIQLHEVVRIEEEIRSVEKALAKEIRAGRRMVATPRGGETENPHYGLLDKLRKQKLAVLRSLGLNAPTVGNQHAAKLRKAPSVADEQAAKNAKSGARLLAV